MSVFRGTLTIRSSGPQEASGGSLGPPSLVMSVRMELGDDVMDLMRDIKKVFDPLGLMNPGKVVPLE